MQRPPPHGHAAPEVAKVVCSKEPFQDADVPRKIQQIRFGLQTPQEMIKTGVLHVYERALYKMPERTPAANGVLDKKLGIAAAKFGTCDTCNQRLADCSGHFGYIKLELPVFHIGYIKNTLQLLQCICKRCSRVLVADEERRKFLKRFRNPRLERVPREHLFKKLIDMCKRCKTCPYCGEHNGTVKRAPGTLKIVHEKFHKNQDALDTYLGGMEGALGLNEAMRPYLNKIADDLHPLRALALFESILPEDLDVLDIGCRPEDLLCRVVPVPPVAIRPSVEMDGASNEDDITMKLMSVIELNNVLRHGLAQGLPIGTLMENWDFLQVQVAQLINSDLPGVSQQNREGGRPTRGFVQRLKGKQGRFRGNLSGKRVDFSARTVISPDPNLAIHQVCVPMHMATTLTYPERVTEVNLTTLRRRVLNGSAAWPGANFVALADGARIWLADEKVRRQRANELKVGDVVERHLADGDLVLFNRQPSLHRISIQAFRAVVAPGRTLRFNECCCSPFNADFDGDEMNLHLPQTEEARAEALTLMSSVRNLCTPKNGEIMISATQDFLTCAFLMTSKDRFLTRAQIAQLLAAAADGCEAVDLPPPAVVKPIELWTGKQMFSCLVRPNRRTRVFVNLEAPEREYTKEPKDNPPRHMCPKDGYVAFVNSDLICGRLGKGILGGGKGGLFGTLAADFSPEVAAATMGRLAKMAARTMGDTGFSIGIDDVTPKTELARRKTEAVYKGYTDCDDLIASAAKDQLELQPGCNKAETLEAKLTGVLNTIRDIAGRVCMDTLAPCNSPLIMSQCGSKGSAINIAQMVACVGQQSVGGKRCFNGFKQRTLPHFRRGEVTPQSKGFVANSFYSGLTPSEFFFHTMAGREGLVDTAVKTAETGYMSRRLMKALEDLYVHYDTTVRNAAGVVVQFTYGDDGLDPVVMEAQEGRPLHLARVLDKVRTTLCYLREPDGAVPPALLPQELDKAIAAALQAPELAAPPDKGIPPTAGEEDSVQDWCSPKFRAEVKEFLEKTAKKYKEARKRLGLPQDARGPLGLEHAAAQEGVTAQQLAVFMRRCLAKYEIKRIEPGSTVGAVGAQSIGEPGTQMTLKTFHFAGVASMNVTLGVPRIKEIINGARKISTPIIQVPLEVDNDVKAARIVKGRLERTTLGQVAAGIAITLRPRTEALPGEAGVLITLNMGAIEALQLQLDAADVKWAILGTPKLKLKTEHVRAILPNQVFVLPPDNSKGSMYFCLEHLMGALPKVIVAGIATVDRAVVTAKENEEGKYKVAVEGTNMQAVMGALGVQSLKVTTNNIAELEKYLGIEAARNGVIHEIKYTMGQHGMSIDDRHTMLLADCMTYKGELLGITRFGIAKMKDSVLHTASFEKTADHLFDAAIHGRVDDVVGVSESIIMGIPMPTGTGLFKLMQHTGDLGALPQRPAPLLLDY